MSASGPSGPLVWGCLGGVMVRGVRRCSARRARRICGSILTEVKIEWVCHKSFCSKLFTVCAGRLFKYIII